MAETIRNLLNIRDRSRFAKASDVSTHFYHINLCMSSSNTIKDIRDAIAVVNHGGLECSLLSLIENTGTNLTDFNLKIIFDSSFGFEIKNNPKDCTVSVFKIDDNGINTNSFRNKVYVHDINGNGISTYDVIERIVFINKKLETIAVNIDTLLERLLKVLETSLTTSEHSNLTVGDCTVCIPEPTLNNNDDSKN